MELACVAGNGLGGFWAGQVPGRVRSESRDAGQAPLHAGFLISLHIVYNNWAETNTAEILLSDSHLSSLSESETILKLFTEE